MKLVGVISTAFLLLALGVAAPAFAQEQHDQDEKSKPAAQEGKKAQPEKSAKPEEKPAARQEQAAKPEEKNEQQHAGNKAGARIPADRYQANFGRQHTFHVSQGDYRNHRFQYGGYWFGFAGGWPSNWLYTQDVYVVEINGVYYLCNPSYPGVNVELSFTL